MVIRNEELLNLLHREGGDRKQKCTNFIQKLSDQFNRYGDRDKTGKFVLRITKGPTDAAIEFHCDGEYATRTVQIALNSTEEYIGGRLCFYVNGNLHVLNERPMGSIVLHPRKVLHAVTTLTKGKRCSLFVVDESNGQFDKEVFNVTSKDVELFLESVEATKKCYIS